VWRPEIAEMQLAVQGEKVVKYLHKGRRVAQLWPEQGRFWCRRPYDLVIENPVDD
jgi:hypothetical protein